jgi:hypothetical protein
LLYVSSSPTLAFKSLHFDIIIRHGVICSFHTSVKLILTNIIWLFCWCIHIHYGWVNQNLFHLYCTDTFICNLKIKNIILFKKVLLYTHVFALLSHNKKIVFLCPYCLSCQLVFFCTGVIYRLRWTDCWVNIINEPVPGGSNMPWSS